MKSRFKKCVAVMVVGILLANTVTVYAEGNEAPVYDVSAEIEMRLTEISQDIASTMEEAIKAEASAKQQYYNLLDKLRSSSNAMTRGVEYDLEQYYGGAYINDDKKLTICCTSDDAQIVSAFKDAAGSDDVIISSAKYTLDELYAIKDELKAVLDIYKDDANLDAESIRLIEDIKQCYVDVINNKIVIGIYEIGSEKVELFYELFEMLSSDAIQLENGRITVPTVTIRPGGRLYLSASASTSGSTGNRSVGYRGYRVDSLGYPVYGFTSCGHDIKEYLYREGVLVGTLYDYRYGGDCDISFYDAESGVTLSNTTAYSNDTGSTNEVVELSIYSVPSNQIVVGSILMKVGGRTFYTQGNITAVGYDCDSSTTNRIVSNALALPGDSGGVAFIEYNGEFRIVGTMSAAYFGEEAELEENFVSSYIADYNYTYGELDSVIYRY